MIKISLYFLVAVRTFSKQTHNKTFINITNFLKSLLNLAEGEGFEPPERCRSTVFKTAAIDHSANPPYFNELFGGQGGIRTHDLRITF